MTKKTLTAVEDIVERAELLYQTGRCDQAVELLLEGSRQFSGEPVFQFRLVEMLMDSGQYQKALELSADRGFHDPDGRLLMLRGVCHEALGNIHEAGTAASRLFDLDARRADALVLRARIALRSGNRKLAEKNFREATALDESCALAFFGLGTLAGSLGKPTLGLDFLEKAFLLSPSSREIVIAYHKAAIASSEYRRAESAFRIALGALPHHRRLRFILIELLLRQNQYDQAMVETESAMNDFGVDDGIVSAALSIRRQIGPLRIPGSPSAQGTVSLCMIVKNEESCLARCLRSAKPFVDEMIVVDTGSTDRTRDIAEAFGALVYEAAWENDFSKARNISLSKASGAWILILDADEVISIVDHVAFKELVKDRRVVPVAYVIQTRNYTYHSNTIGWSANTGEYPEEKGPGWFPSDKARLFTNDPRIRFSNPVHELVEPCLRSLNVPLRRCDIPVHHYGKLQEVKTFSKTKTYRNLGQGKLKKNRQNISAVREHAIQCACLGKHDEALNLWKEFIQKRPYSAEAYVNMGASCWNLGSYVEAANYAEKALRINPAMKEARFNRAVALLMMGQAFETKSILQGVLENEPNYPAAQFMLCVAHVCLGGLHEAEGIYSALKSLPMGEYIHVSFLEVAKKFFSASRFDYARSTLEAALHLGCVNSEIVSLLENCKNAA